MNSAVPCTARNVLADDALGQQGPYPREREHRFDDHRARDELTDAERGQCHERERRGPERVPNQDPGVGDTSRPSRKDVVLELRGDHDWLVA
jgi:hypothetical protein